jgi:hypothetical protein
MAATLFERIDAWRPGCWCAARLKLCDVHVVEGEHEDTRYPEQWMAVLWRPMAQALPWWRPDGWAFTVGSPQPWITESVEGAPVYVLADHECLWSAWLDISLACERTEPWFTRLLQEHKARQLDAEMERNIAWYGSRGREFEHFLQQLTAPADVPSETMGLPRTAGSTHAAVKEVTLPSWPKSTACARLMPDGALEFELYDRDYLKSERADIWRVEATEVGLLCAALAQRLGESVDSADDLLDRLAHAFASWTSFKPWLLDGPWAVRHRVNPWP